MNLTSSTPHPKQLPSSMRIAAILMLQLCLLLVSATARGDWQEAGVRIGIQGAPKHEYFHQYEAFAVYGLPWEWRTSSGWGVAPQLNVAASALHDTTETGFLGTFGTGLTFDKRGKGIALEVGINADLLDRRQFGQQDFGSIFQLGAYMGVAYRFANGLGLGYRLQHLSNGHIFYPNGTPNPGLDMHMIGVSWNF